MSDRIHAAEEGERVQRKAEVYARTLVRGTLDTREALDKRIADAAPAFPIDQLPVTDRVALEMALFEMMHERDTPTAVIIDEAVELAKTYGGDSSGRFVNGVLGTIAGDIRPGQRGPEIKGTRRPKKL